MMSFQGPGRLWLVDEMECKSTLAIPMQADKGPSQDP